MHFDKQTLLFTNAEDECTMEFKFMDHGHEYFTLIREKYRLLDLIEHCQNELEKLSTLCHWTHSVLNHNGMEECEELTPVSIIDEAMKGRGFRCVEFAVALNGVINSIGIHSRFVNLMGKDVETMEEGAGHCVIECYSGFYNKWIMVDAAFDMLPVLRGVPLNAVELYYALNSSENVHFISLSDYDRNSYIEEIMKYLFYFSASFDNKAYITDASPDHQKLMLVPVGHKKPRIFQKQFFIRHTTYTNSTKLYYTSPRLIRRQVEI